MGPCDLVDGTPVFDIKPYVPAYDSFPEAKAGWIEAVDAAMAAPPAYRLEWAPLAQEQARWLREEWSVDYTAQMEELLRRDPSVHRTRRIRKRSDGRREIGCGAWRGVFRVEGDLVTVLSLESGYPVRFLVREGYAAVPEREAQLAFHARWPWETE